jgi:hypothetical protein
MQNTYILENSYHDTISYSIICIASSPAAAIAKAKACSAIKAEINAFAASYNLSSFCYNKSISDAQIELSDWDNSEPGDFLNCKQNSGIFLTDLGS